MAKKILLFVSSMNAGGAERVAANLANAWADRGDSVALIITYSQKGDCFYEISDKVNIVYLADIARQSGRNVVAYWARFRALRRFIRDSRADVALSFLTNVNVAVLIASIGLACPVIVSERSYPPMLPISPAWKWLRKITYARAAAVAMLTKEGLCWLKSHIPAANGALIPNPVTYPVPIGRPLIVPDEHITPERRMLLAIGRLDEGKQFDRLITAFTHLADSNPSWDLVILGEGPKAGALREQVISVGLSDRIKLLGRAGNVADWYRRADLYVMTSRYEGFPNTLIEAMAYGCPAVSYDCDTGPRDIIRHEWDGLLVDLLGDIPALAKTLGRLMGDNQARMIMAQRATDVRERFSLQMVLPMWDNLIESAIKRRLSSGCSDKL